jgi:hypothetical protein
MLDQRLIEKSVPITESGCLVWLGRSSERHGLSYGYFRSHRKTALVHRAAYESEYGPIPHGLEIDHLCRVTLCVNPDHLEAVTHQDNCLRGNGVSGINARKTHCIRGHRYTKDTIALGNYGKYCRTCRNDKAGTARDARHVASGVPYTRGIKRTHCKYGHPATSENTTICGSRRCCRICANIAQLARYHKNKAKA